MGFIKAIVGGLIGAIIAIVVLAYLPGRVPSNYLWYPLVTGLLTGLGVRLACGSKSHVSAYLTGGVAALIALFAILQGDEIIAKTGIGNTQLAPAVARSQPKGGPPSVTAKNDSNEAGDPLDDSAGSEPESTGDDDKADDDKADDDKADDDKADDDKADDEGADDEGAALVSDENPAPVVRDNVVMDDATTPVGRRASKLSWRTIAPFLFAGLGVLLAYELGKVPASPREKRE